jgi:hypothetical protein
MDEIFTRRDILRRGAAFGALAVVGASVACNKAKPAALSCTDTSALAPADLTVRTSLAYVDVSTEPGKSCSGCLQFIPATPDVCGACKVVKGPINPAGYCKSFSPKPT